MTIRQKRTLFLFILISFSTLVGILIVLALKENINLFFTPTQVVEQTKQLINQSTLKIRVGGMVKRDTVQRDTDLNVKFMITDFKNNINIEYKGILPDLFREGQGVVVRGHLQKNGIFKADEVLAKHDENYMPKEMKTISKTTNNDTMQNHDAKRGKI